MTIELLSKTPDRERFIYDFGAIPRLVRPEEYRQSLIPDHLRSSLLSIPIPTPREFWIAYQDEVPIASIGAMCAAGYESIGYIGFIEYDTAHPKGKEGIYLLINDGLSFLKAHGRIEAYGPMQYNTWFPYRYRTSKGTSKTFSWEPGNPPEYIDAIIHAGFREDMLYHSTAFGNLSEYLAETQPALDEAIANKYTFRPFDASKWQSRELPALYRIIHEAFKDNFLFESLPKPLFDALYVQIANKQNQHAYMVLNPDGKEVGFVFAFVDTADGEKYLVIKTLAVLPEARGKGLSNALTHLVLEDGLANGTGHGIAAMVRAGIQSESYAKKGSFYWRNQYALFKKSLAD